MGQAIKGVFHCSGKNGNSAFLFYFIFSWAVVLLLCSIEIDLGKVL